MRASELLATGVVDADGRELGPVRDVRLARRNGAFVVVGLVVGGGRGSRVAHSWGYAEGRAQGPLLLRALTRGAARNARFVPAERVVEWSPSVRIDCRGEELPGLRDEVGE